MSRKKVGVLGAGTMGVGIAHTFAEYDYDVIVIDNQQEVLDNFNTALEQSYKMQCMLGKPRAPLQMIRNNIQIEVDLARLSGCSFLIENTTESIEVKSALLSKLNGILKSDCIIAINTSCIPITALNKHINWPDRMVGIHFMNPVPMKSFVEIIQTSLSSKKTLNVVKDILTSIGKSGIVVNDNPGFVINRVFMVTVNEAIKVFEEKLCQEPSEIDELFVKCLGHRMGPLMTADLIGLDTILYSLNVLHQQFLDDMYLPAKLLISLVNQGKLGRKSGSGLYDYSVSLV